MSFLSYIADLLILSDYCSNNNRFEFFYPESEPKTTFSYQNRYKKYLVNQFRRCSKGLKIKPTHRLCAKSCKLCNMQNKIAKHICMKIEDTTQS